ncbi:hypothetical protein C922_01812 [Plasmodium inui San Antonio 1]|uniref:Uncharacterized protein n=1 Tax=Plasmodium inui San Antonio 1 TaxID=1237626 RepID=W7A322_9APIC|nr:hypothetical protein C922_01812 [Plasmodium inui San Antonio 1]EUD67627.1 hypothetical protein C922_01812 [Plasmodium inui San Antonio 1]
MASATHSDGGRKNTSGGETTSYDDLIELRKRIILKEKELLQKKKWPEKASAENGGEEITAKEQKKPHHQEGNKGKVTYRSFDEFYRYKKHFEEHEVKVRRDAMKSLRKCGGGGNEVSGCNERRPPNDVSGGNERRPPNDVSGGNERRPPNDVSGGNERCPPNDVHAANQQGDRGDHRYSYIKLKMERQGTVKQLKEYFQKIQQDQVQKRKNEMLLRRDKKGATVVAERGKERGANGDGTLLERMENEKRCYPSEPDLGTTLHPYADGVSSLEGEAKREDQMEKEVEKQMEKQVEKQLDSQMDRHDSKELELLHTLISEMKKSSDKGEDYIANLVQDLRKSNKRHLVLKILQMLQSVDSRITSEQGKKALERDVSQVGEGDTDKQDGKVTTWVTMESNKHTGKAEKRASPEREKTDGGNPKVLPKGSFTWSRDQKNDKEKKTPPIRSGSPIHVKIKKYNDAVEAGYSQMSRALDGKVEDRRGDGNLPRTVERRKGPTKGGETMNKENSAAEGVVQHGKGNQLCVTSSNGRSDQTGVTSGGANSQSEHPNDNVGSLRPNGSTEKSEANHAGKFEWFYSTMKDLYSEDGEVGGEPDGGLSAEPDGGISVDPNDYSSEGSENNDLFLWLENRDVENVLSAKKRSDEGETSEESGLLPVS